MADKHESKVKEAVRLMADDLFEGEWHNQAGIIERLREGFMETEIEAGLKDDFRMAKRADAWQQVLWSGPNAKVRTDDEYREEVWNLRRS